MRSPFKFLDAYTLEDKDHFFGRDQEVDELYRMVFKTPLALIYGLSGTGKTSLVQCGLASHFDGPDWYPFLIRRQGDINRSLRSSLREALGGELPEKITDAVQQLYRYSLRPIYLIFDQFEELFILGDRAEQDQFMQDVKALQESDLACTVLLIMREEYLGYLYPFEKLIPTLYDFRLRVEPMSRAKVKEVIGSSFTHFNIKLEEPSEENLQLIVDNVSDGKSGIQLPYLQVYLDQLYQEDYKKTYGNKERGKTLPPLTFTQRKIAQLGEIENALERFINQKEQELQTELSQRHADFPPQMMKAILDAFVTEEGTKRPVPFSRDENTKMLRLDAHVKRMLPPISEQALSDSIELLEQNRLVRLTDANIELAHDSLAALIDERRSDEQRQLNQVKRHILNSYQDYQLSEEYLSRKQILAYELFIPQLSLEEPVRQYIQDSIENAERQEREEEERQRRELDLVQQKLAAEQKAIRRQRFFSRVVMGIALVAIALGVLAWQNGIKVKNQNSKLQENAFYSSLSFAETLKKEGHFAEAFDKLDTAQTLASTPQQREQVSSISQLYKQLEELVVAADTMAKKENDYYLYVDRLAEAKNNYQQAQKLAPQDRLLFNKHQQLELDINELYSEMIDNAQKLIRIEGCEEDGKNFIRLAQSLKDSIPPNLAACLRQ